MCLAWETAVKKQAYDYYLWLNDDVIIFKNGIVTLLENQKQHVNSVICGVMASKLDNSITYGGRDKESKLIIPNNKTPKLCYYINGNFVLIPKSIYKKVGFLDKLFPHAIGDFDYGLRVIDNGFECRISSKIVGFCETNDSLPGWCLPEVSFLKRIRSLYSPLGSSHPYYFFIYEYRHFDIFKALKHFITIHLRLIIPKIWLR
jgi:GT2 family glycosyltransferase